MSEVSRDKLNEWASEITDKFLNRTNVNIFGALKKKRTRLLILLQIFQKDDLEYLGDRVEDFASKVDEINKQIQNNFVSKNLFNKIYE